MDNNNNVPTHDPGLGKDYAAWQVHGLTAPVEYSGGHPPDGSQPSISMPPFPPTK